MSRKGLKIPPKKIKKYVDLEFSNIFFHIHVRKWHFGPTTLFDSVLFPSLTPIHTDDQGQKLLLPVFILR